MKKRNLLLALLSSSLILASCGDDKTAQESGKETETSQQSGDSNEASLEPGQTVAPDTSVDTRTNAEKVKALFDEMALGKSSTVEYNGTSTEFYGNDKGFWDQVPASNTQATSYGVAVIPNYGIYEVYWDDTVQEYYLADIISPNKTLKVSDVMYTTLALGEAAKTITFTESSRTHTFSTDNVTFCNTLLGILGGGSLASVYDSKKVTFNVNEDGSALTNMTLDLSAPNDTKYKALKLEGIKIFNIGKTSDLDFEVLITNPGIAARTAWTSYELQYFAQLHTNFSLPFPTGASYAVNVSALENGTFVFQDLGSGNLSNSYKTQLAGAGFTPYDDLTDTQKGVFAYEKTLVPANGSVGAIKEIVLFGWENDATKATLYPNGEFVIMAYPMQEVIKITVAELNTLLGSHTLNDGVTHYWPDIELENCTGANVQDLTADANAYYQGTYDFEFYGVIRLYFATEAEAIAAVTYINGQLAKNGYSANPYGGSGYIMEVTDPYTYEVDEAYVSAEVAYDDNGNYLGYVELTIYHDSFEDYYY